MSIVQPINAIQAALLGIVIPIAMIFLIIGAIRWNRGDREGLRMVFLSVAAVVIVGVGPQVLDWSYRAASQVVLPAPNGR